MARRVDFYKSYESYLRNIREAQARGVTHKVVYTREQYKTVYNDFKNAQSDIPGAAQKNIPRFLEQESRETSYRSIRALRGTLRAARQDILAKEAAGEKLTGVERVLRDQGLRTSDLYSADSAMLWKQLHNMYSREEIAAILGSPEEEETA